MPIADLTLEDRLRPDQDRLFLTGTQTLVRVLLTQAWLDQARGARTGGFVSGYRGSPLGAFDGELTAAEGAFAKANIHFEPGVNEELAATALMGTQQVGLFPGARVEGVFGMWYGKGPGADRAGDAFKHANLAGTAPEGGVLAVVGDDHGGVSSTTAHQSEFAFIDAQIPVLAPTSLQDVLELGLAGIAMSRASGCWVALKCPSAVIEQAGTVEAALSRFSFTAPDKAGLPDGGLHIRWPDKSTDQEHRLSGPKLRAAEAFALANGLDRTFDKTAARRIGIVAAGKAFADTREALRLLGLGGEAGRAAGLCLFKPAMVWPLVADTVRTFAEGLDEIIVIEEKRALIEPQIRDILYAAPQGARPKIFGKQGADGAALIPLSGVIEPDGIARALAGHLGRTGGGPGIAVSPPPPLPEPPAPVLRRPPHFCSGCPHNTSTRVPEGHRALAGIGCHTLALWSDPNTQTLTQMGGEGVSWIGQAPFTDTPHVFTNIGDGTYYHSGFLAIRAALSAKVNITFKLLYNDAVAMTGGQAVEGGLTVPAIARELAAEGVARIVVVAEEPGHYPRTDRFPEGVTVLGRDGFDCAQTELASTPGVTVLIFDQTCAAEKRRRRRRGTMEDPDRWVFINERVCEGCGDCQQASHCLSVVPVETPLGEKRRIDYASCNKDESCLNGFCPALVTVEGKRKQTGRGAQAAAEPAEIPVHLTNLPAPDRTDAALPQRILVAGIGGTGVVTVGHLIALAAHMEGRAVTVMDQTGLAQKGGSVMSHVTVAGAGDDITAARIAAGQADAILGCDLVVAADTPQLHAMSEGRTRAVVNSAEAITGAFLRDPGRAFPKDPLLAALTARLGGGALALVDATSLAARLTGNPITANVFLLGFAWQQGLVPVTEEALVRAIELNAVAAEANREAFAWGRRAAVDGAAVAALAGLDGEKEEEAEPELEAMIETRADFLARYGGPDLARRYREIVTEMERISGQRVPGRAGLARAVAEGYFKVLAAKDEYEVGRLYTDGVFDAALAETFEPGYRVHYHMAPPWISRRDKLTGHPIKRRFGPWLRPVLKALGLLRYFRGILIDPFRATADRRLEQTERTAYEQDLLRICRALDPENFDLCLELAAMPSAVRGFGHVKRAAFDAMAPRRAEIRAGLDKGNHDRLAAE
jgi:indolepyruvate ferredoxin oxidoreductase